MKTLGIWGAQQETLPLCQGSSVALHMIPRRLPGVHKYSSFSFGMELSRFCDVIFV